jgi:predicted lipoprotein with Yx(FWY)xxD motif
VINTRTFVAASAALIAVVLISACSSSGSSRRGAPAAGATHSGAVIIQAHHGAKEAYLTDAAGKTLYEFASDTATTSSCSGSCATYWPPVTTTGAVDAPNLAGKLTTIRRADGSKQVVYAGHPLYYFSLDKVPGDTNGEGRTDFGAAWWLLSPSGSPITTDAASSSAPSPGGYGY